MLFCLNPVFFHHLAYQVVKSGGIPDPQLSVKGIGFDRSLGGLEMELRLRDYLIKVRLIFLRLLWLYR